MGGRYSAARGIISREITNKTPCKIIILTCSFHFEISEGNASVHFIYLNIIFRYRFLNTICEFVNAINTYSRFKFRV